jgi:hypothetical protein
MNVAHFIEYLSLYMAWERYIVTLHPIMLLPIAHIKEAQG